MKRYQLQYGNGVAVLPLRAVTECNPPDGAYLRVLLFLCARPALLEANGTPADGTSALDGTSASGGGADGGLAPALAAALSAASGVPRAVTENALAYWEAQGILTCTDTVTAGQTSGQVTAMQDTAGKQTAGQHAAIQQTAAGQQTAAVPNPPAAGRKALTVLPEYTAAQVADAADRNPDLRPMLDLCEQTAGKLFSEHENAQVTALYDCYGLDGEFIVTVFAYCREKGHSSVSYVIRTALGMYDEGIRTPAALNERIKSEKRLQDSTEQIRRIFGMGERALTAREKQYITCWTETWAMPVEVIRCAYEITIRNIERPNLSYVNKILSRWNDAGIRTPEAVQAAEETYAKQKTESAAAPRGEDGGGHSFNTEEFLDLAMKRSFRKEE